LPTASTKSLQTLYSRWRHHDMQIARSSHQGCGHACSHAGMCPMNDMADRGQSLEPLCYTVACLTEHLPPSHQAAQTTCLITLRRRTKTLSAPKHATHQQVKAPALSASMLCGENPCRHQQDQRAQSPDTVSLQRFITLPLVTKPAAQSDPTAGTSV
jgi:hypothetical protein